MTTTSQFTLSERNGLVYKPHPRFLAQNLSKKVRLYTSLHGNKNNTELRISLEVLAQCSANMAPENNYVHCCAIDEATPIVPVSFYQKTKYYHTLAINPLR